jgi:hypothetical protein
VTVAVNPYVQLPAMGVNEQYRMGASFTPDPINDFWWNVTDDSGNLAFTEQPDGWDSLTFVSPLDSAGNRDGGLSGPSTVSARMLAISGAILVGSSPAGLRGQIQRLRSMLGPRKTVVWEQFDYSRGIRVALECTASGDFAPTAPFGRSIGGEACTVSFTLQAGSPWKVASGGSPESLFLNLPVDAVSGFTFPLGFPFNFGATTNPGGQGVANNVGDEPAYPISLVTGPVAAPIISDDTTLQSFSFLDDIPSGTTVQVDHQTGVVTPGNFRLSGPPFALDPGANLIRWRAAAGSFNATASLVLQWRSTMG